MNKWKVIDRKTSRTGVIIADGVSKEDFPFMVMKPCFTFAYGELAALCHNKETAEQIAEGMNLLNQIKEWNK